MSNTQLPNVTASSFTSFVTVEQEQKEQEQGKKSHMGICSLSSDFIFSHSLATLRECTIEREEGGSQDEAPITSGSAHSVISVIPSQEIQRMIQEVSNLDDDMLKVQ